MSARLASLLVNEGVLAGETVSAALGRQVMYGGSLDTALLEMRAADEPTLWSALARASGLPVPAQALIESPSADGAALFDGGWSDRCHAVPVARDGNVLKLLCSEPPATEALAEASHELGLGFELFVVPEVRLQAAREAIYGRAMPARYLALLGKVLGAQPVRRWAEAHGQAPAATETTPPPAGGATEEGALASGRLPPVVAEGTTRTPVERSADGARTTATRPETGGPAAAERRSAAVAHDPDSPATHEPSDGRAVLTLAGAAWARGTDAPAPGSDVASRATTAVAAASQTTGAEEAAAPAERSHTPETTPRDVVLHRLAGAQTRDEIFEMLAEAAAARMSFVVVLSVSGQGESRVAQGRVARAGQKQDRNKIAQIFVPLARSSPFHTVTETGLPFVGPPGAGEVMRKFLDEIRRAGMPEIVLVPVMLRGRAVGVIYGDRAGAFALGDDTGELAVFAATAAKALEMFILRSKAESYARADAAADRDRARLAPPRQGTPEPTAVGEAPLPAPGGWTRPSAAAVARTVDVAIGEVAPEPPLEEQRSDLDALLDAYEVDPEGPIGSAAGSAILRRGDVSAVLGRLSQRLHQGRHTGSFETAMLRLVVTFGDAALPLVRPLLDHPDPGWRRRAAEMLVTLRAAGSEEALCRLATDADAGVRASALRALRLRAEHPEVQALARRLREQLENASPASAAAAAAALGELRDPEAVPLLIDKLKGQAPPVIIAAHRALVAIAKQDFGDSRWRWGSWWKRWRERDRMEWLLEGLSHKSPEVRLSASEELRHLTGEYFGYHFDLPRRERDEARRRWVDWWRRRRQDEQTSA